MGNKKFGLLLGTSRDVGGFTKARELLNENIKRTNAALEDKRALAVVLSTRPEEEHIYEAISILQQVVKSQPQYSLSDNYLLAQMYAKTNQWPQYTSTMRGVLGNGGANDSRYVSAYADQLLARGEEGEARLWVERLKALAPAEKDTDTLEAQLWIGAGDFARLKGLLAERSKNPERLQWTAEMAEIASIKARELKNEAASKEFMELSKDYFTKLADSSPNGKILLAAYFARRGAINESLEQLNDSSGDRSTQLADLAQSAMSTGESSAEGLKQLTSEVAAESQKTPKNNRLLMALGDLLAWQGEVKSAVINYDKVISNEPGHMLAINNSAMARGLAKESLQKPYKRSIKPLRRMAPCITCWILAA